MIKSSVSLLHYAGAQAAEECFTRASKLRLAICAGDGKRKVATWMLVDQTAAAS
jgi:hypothetical protein